MNTLTDVLLFAIRHLPIREEAQLNELISIVEDARPALDKVVEDFKNSAKTVAEDVKNGVSTVVADAETVIKGL